MCSTVATSNQRQVDDIYDYYRWPELRTKRKIVWIGFGFWRTMQTKQNTANGLHESKRTNERSKKTKNGSNNIHQLWYTHRSHLFDDNRGSGGALKMNELKFETLRFRHKQTWKRSAHTLAICRGSYEQSLYVSVCAWNRARNSMYKKRMRMNTNVDRSRSNMRFFDTNRMCLCRPQLHNSIIIIFDLRWTFA